MLHLGVYLKSLFMGKKPTVFNLLGLYLPMGLALLIGSAVIWTEEAYADSGQPQLSPKSEEVPEEVLQIQVGVEANSALTGQAQNAEAHAQERQQLQVGAADVPPKLSPSIYRAVELLRLRQILKSLLPFL
jgi:hypothetical protein